MEIKKILMILFIGALFISSFQLVRAEKIINLKTIEPIYFGVYDNVNNEWVIIDYVLPSSKSFILNLDVYKNKDHSIYYFYNLGFGEYE